MTNIKSLISSRAMSSNSEPTSFEMQDSIPIVDYSLLTSGTADERSKVVRDIGNACHDWGCFMLVNHGIPETLIQKMMEATDEFFHIPEEEKFIVEAHGALDPIRCSNGVKATPKYAQLFKREYLRLFVHPDFHCPDKPASFSELISDYVKKTRSVAMELLKGVSESLGLEASDIHQELNLEKVFQLLSINYYPSGSEIDSARGLMPHSDHGLLTLLYENGVPGLEVLCNEKWVGVSEVPNAYLILNSDQLEIFSNGRYKGKLHRVVMKDERKRISLVTANGPSLDTIVGPSSRLVDGENRLPGYLPMKYSEYIEFQMTSGKIAINEVRLHN